MKKLSFSDFSIRNKLIFIIVTTSAIAVITGLSISLFVNYFKLRRELKENARISVDLVGQYAAAPLLFGFREEAGEVLSKLVAMPAIVDACLYEPDSINVFSVYHHDPNSNFIFPAPQPESAVYEGKYLLLFHTVKYKGQLCGAIFFRLSTASIHNSIKSELLLMLIIICLIIVFVIVMANHLQKHISVPILKLANLTKQISGGEEYKEMLYYQGDDEIGILYHNFDHMLQQIFQREHEKDAAEALLKVANEQLKADLSRREKAEKEISFLAQVLRNINEQVCITDTWNNISFINQSWLRTYGFTEEEVMGKPIGIIHSQSNPPGILEEIRQATLAGGWHGELINKRKDDSEFPVLLSTTTIHDKDNTPIALVGISSDISEARQIREELINHRNNLEKLVLERTGELNKARIEAESANKAKSEFLANMSHEIRTPMNAVLGYTELLGLMLTDSNQKNYVESIKSSGRSLLTIINDILDLSKIEAGKLELNYEYVDTLNFFREFERIFALKATEKGIKFNVEISGDTPPGILIDEPRLRQIIFNLIGNAIKFTEKGHVLLHVYSEKQNHLQEDLFNPDHIIDIVIEVVDTGIGIAADMIDEIFDPFIQARDKRVTGGTGLGLAISKRLVSLMNGKISLKSQRGKGSIFTITIPRVSVKNDFTPEAEQTLVDVTRIKFEKSLLLIVDDVELNRAYIRDVLKNTEIKLVEAVDGVRAFDFMNEFIPDLVISDIRMPEMDGFELLEKMRSSERLKNIPVIAYSASVLKEQMEKIQKSRFSGLLLKPVNITSLYNELMNFLPYSVTSIEDTDKESKFPPELSKVKDLPGLLASLDFHLANTWKSFETRQPINEVRKFGEELYSLGKKHDAFTIYNFGNELRSAAENFNVQMVISLIRQFPSVLETMKKNQSSD